MKRRRFITAVAGSALLATPLALFASKISPVKTTCNIATDFSIDQSGDIRYIGDATSPPKYCVQDLYNYIRDECKDECRMDGHLLTLDPPINVDDNAVAYLRSGSISQFGRSGKPELYMGNIEIGPIR